MNLARVKKPKNLRNLSSDKLGWLERFCEVHLMTAALALTRSSTRACETSRMLPI
jgi:hypothetical protein